MRCSFHYNKCLRGEFHSQNYLQTYCLTSNFNSHTLISSLLRFGRKDAAYPHADGQGIGTGGAGVTAAVIEMLAGHGCRRAAGTLLAGRNNREGPLGDNGLISCMPEILPKWIPMRNKLRMTEAMATATVDQGAVLMIQMLLCGDSNLAQFLRHSAENCHTAATGTVLPKPLDLSCILAEELALDALRKEGSVAIFDAIRLFDLAATSSSESLLGQLALSFGTGLSSPEALLEGIANAGYNRVSRNTSKVRTIDKYAKLSSDVALRLIQLHATDKDVSHTDLFMPQIAPSAQHVSESDRVRNAILCHKIIQTDKNFHHDATAWNFPVNVSKHVWSEGPFGKKESLLELSQFEDWLGRFTPAVLGKEGVAIASDTGERTLAEIMLAAAQDDGQMDGSMSVRTEEKPFRRQKDWVKGVGEARLEEDNISLYMRFSEGADEDHNWKANGFRDLTKYAHTARLYGSELVSVEATTSSVDEGEEGKVSNRVKF